MDKASSLSPKVPQIWLTLGNIKRKNDRIKEALDKYEIAYKLDQDDPIILNSLGQAKCRSGEYEEANRLFMSAMQKEVSGSSIKHKIINISSIAENLSRWGAALAKDRNYEMAEKKLKEALQHCKELLVLDNDDPKSKSLLRQIYMKLGFFYKNNRKSKDAIAYFEKVVMNKPKRYAEIKDAVISALQAGRLLQQMGETDKARAICTNELQRAAERLDHDLKLQEDLKTLIHDLERIAQIPVPGRITDVNPSRGS